MTLEVTFKLEDADLESFRQLFQAARERAGETDPRQVVAAARELVDKRLSLRPTEFIRKRLEGLRQLTDMVEDETWGMPDEERGRVLEALAYFVAKDDVIPDDTPVIGLLDDAIAAEILLRSLEHEMRAYADFCQYRAAEQHRRKEAGETTDIAKEDWLEDRRAALHTRMREHRVADSAGWHITMWR